MPRHVSELRNGDPFPVKPGTNEYEALSFLVSNREYGFTPAEIADRTGISDASASKTMARLFEKGLVERFEGIYYVEPDRADDLKQRLDSIDAAARLHDTAPSDDAYADESWEDNVPSINLNQDQSGSEIVDEHAPEDEAERLVDQLAEEKTGK